MKKFVVAALTVLVVAGVVAGGVAAKSDGGTVVARGFSCGVIDGNGGVFTTTNSVLTVYQTKAVLQCSGDGAAGPAPHPKYFTYANWGGSCGMLQFGSTTNFIDKVGYNGNSQLTCVQYLDGVDSASGAGAGIG